MGKAKATRYYAVPDPTTGDMTYWRRNERGQLAAWPSSPPAKYGPILWSRTTRDLGPHDFMVPTGLTKQAEEAWVRDWYATVRQPWHETIAAAIAADPEAAMARFSVWCIRCACCGRALTDDDSKVLGLGPECRSGLPDSVLQAVAREVAQIHGQAVKVGE